MEEENLFNKQENNTKIPINNTPFNFTNYYIKDVKPDYYNKIQDQPINTKKPIEPRPCLPVNEYFEPKESKTKTYFSFMLKKSSGRSNFGKNEEK